jgi:hypothetical protein
MHQRSRRRPVGNNSTSPKAPLWVSRNKVLSGLGLKKTHARNPNFDSEETKVLISLWGDPKIQKQLITTHKKQPVIASIGESMREYGYFRSTEELNTRIKNLKCFYNRILKERHAGAKNTPSWKHFDAMDEIMNRPIFGNIGTQQQYQNIYEAKKQQKQQMTHEFGVVATDSSASDNEILVKEELMSSDDDNSIRPEDLLQVEGHNFVADVDIDENELIIPKTEPECDDVDVDYTIPEFNISSVTSNAVRPVEAETAVVKPVTTTTTLAPAATSTQNKISLVPANILLKPQTLNFPQQKFILQNTNPSPVAVSSSSVSGGGGMPMKLVFLKSSQTACGGNFTTTFGTVPSGNNSAHLKTVNSTPTLLTTSIQQKPQLPQLQPKPTMSAQQPFIFQQQQQQQQPKVNPPKLLPSNFCNNEPQKKQLQQQGK